MCRPFYGIRDVSIIIVNIFNGKEGDTKENEIFTNSKILWTHSLRQLHVCSIISMCYFRGAMGICIALVERFHWNDYIIQRTMEITN